MISGPASAKGKVKKQGAGDYIRQRGSAASVEADDVKTRDAAIQKALVEAMGLKLRYPLG
jgi:hypothetical protein